MYQKGVPFAVSLSKGKLNNNCLMRFEKRSSKALLREKENNADDRKR